ncbi:MAG TPA: glycosyltransferase family 4 protein [Tepidisphaeraceae bacterium]|nr:glycosyltransferase family 4 protein [Tepidisphaeraceae bacterium]
MVRRFPAVERRGFLQRKKYAMRVAIVSQPWSRVPAAPADSIGILTHQLARHLAPLHEVTVYSRQFSEDPAVQCIEGFNVRRVPATIDRILKPLRLLDRIPVRYPRRPFIASRLYQFGYMHEIASDLARRGCRIVHLHNFPHCARLVRRAHPDCKIILHVHSDWLVPLDHNLISRQLRDVDLILGVSDFITRRLRERFPDAAPRCHTIYNGVDVQRFNNRFARPPGNNGNPLGPGPVQNDGAGPAYPRLLYVGRVSPEKGVHVLIEAFERVLDRYPHATLTIAGPQIAAQREFIDPTGAEPKLDALDGFFRHRHTYCPHLREMLSPAASARVRFVGNIPHEQLVEYYCQADLCVAPSIVHEAFGLPLAESMAAGTPVVATRSGGFGEIVIEGKTGLLVERGDSADLASAILKLAGDPALRRAMADASRQSIVDRFAWTRILPQLLRQYDQLLGGDGDDTPPVRLNLPPVSQQNPQVQISA